MALDTAGGNFYEAFLPDCIDGIEEKVQKNLLQLIGVCDDIGEVVGEILDKLNPLLLEPAGYQRFDLREDFGQRGLPFFRCGWTGIGKNGKEIIESIPPA